MKKLLSLFLVGSICMLGACGSDETSQPTSTSTNQPTSIPTSTQTTQPTTAPTSAQTSQTTTTVPSTPSQPTSTVPSQTTSNPTTGPLELTNTTLFAVGDSTVSSFADSYYYPRYGYGTQLANYFDSKVTVNNLALSGRSSKSFTSEANYQTLKSSIKEGDFLLIGFGHNDEKSDDAIRFTDASKPVTDPTSFKYSLYENYIKLAQEKGATPILCTPIVRADTANNYTGASGHITATGDYAQAIIELGQDTGTTVIDLRGITKAEYETIGYNEAIYYHAMTAGKYDTDGTTVIADTSSVDKTHLNVYGAKFVAYNVAKELKQTNNRLGLYVKEDIAKPQKDADLVSNASYVVPSYIAPELSTYQAQDHFKTLTSGWYGTAFGDCGGTPTSAVNGYQATETTEGVFTVGQTASSSKGKFASGGDGIAFLFTQVEANKNFTISVDALVKTTASVKQSGFGLMLRDDAYINQNTSKVLITTNYVAAGFKTSDSTTSALFSRENNALVDAGNTIGSLYQVDETAKFTITRVGQSVTTTIEYLGQTYTKTYYDFDFFATDGNFMYVGMYATRGTVVEFTNLNFVITGESQGA